MAAPAKTDRAGRDDRAQQILDFYSQPGAMTSPGRHARSFVELPSSVADLARLVSGLLLHEHFAPEYGVTLSNERRSESQIRAVERMLDGLLRHDDLPLSAPRSTSKRLVGVCRHFTVMLVAMLRAKGIPARARCGFAAYFNRDRFEDHWVCEYWSTEKGRWALVDAQIDDLQRSMLAIDFDWLDVPRNRFVIAADAWAQCRAGDADPASYGIFDLRGLWFVGGNVLRDLAALNNMEMLPWDAWGRCRAARMCCGTTGWPCSTGLRPSPAHPTRRLPRWSRSTRATGALASRPRYSTPC
jgi:hypothetical protein